MEHTNERIEMSSLSTEQWELLCDLAHETAAQEAANAINAGDTIDYLLTRGHTWAELRNHIN